MQHYKTSHPITPAVAVSLLLTACTLPVTGWADGSTTLSRSSPTLQADVTEQANAQLKVANTSVSGSANLYLGGGGASAGATASATDSSKDKGGKGGGGLGSDGGTAPVPEPATWVGLGSLLAMCVGFVAWERRKKNPPHGIHLP